MNPFCADDIVALFAKHPEYKPCQGDNVQIDDEDQKFCCAAAIIAVDEGVDILNNRVFLSVAKRLGIEGREDIIGLAYGFDGVDPTIRPARATVIAKNQTRRDLYLIGREAAKKLGLPVPPLDVVTEYFAAHPLS